MPGDRELFLRIVCGVAWLSAQAAAAADSPRDPPSYNRDVRPILAEKCFRCHGPDAAQRQAGLRLDTAEGGRAAADSGLSAIVPERPEESELVRRIFTEVDDERMPPAESGKSLGDAERQTLKRWVTEGANYERHWSFHLPQRPAVPQPPEDGWRRNEIDFFVLLRLRAVGLATAVEADKRTLIRRLSLDLTGLPPTVEEVDAFLADGDPQAYERVVDRLLASPHYGERMALEWLDLARYADTDGYEKDSHRQMWPYRDWVIASLNDNMPFDQFTIEQLAGDLLPNPTPWQKIATAFNRNGPTTSEAGSDPAEYAVKYAVDRVSTTATVWLGLTMQCAECHDHKFDPLTARDFYSFVAFFDQVPETPLYEGADSPPSIPAPPGPTSADASSSAATDKPPMVRVMQDLPERRPTHLLMRGDYRSPGEQVLPAVPAALGSLPMGEAANRLTLARWLVGPGNPLTARVAVNRLWAMCFGTGIVRTVDDFGSQGEWPTHPELLDWLATEFVASGWDVKRMLRLLVTSSTYRQASAQTAAAAEHDPENRLLSRASRRRMPAEMIRDNALFVGGLLHEKLGGPSVFPYHPPGLWEEMAWADAPHKTWIEDQGTNIYRRGLYTFWKRSLLHPAFALFDAPSRTVCAFARPATNSPLQSFVTLNETSFVEAARGLAGRALADCDGDPAERIEWMYETALAREPSAAETTALAALHEKAQSRFQADPQAAEAYASVGRCPRPEGVNVPQYAAWTIVAQVVLNLDETVTRE